MTSPRDGSIQEDIGRRLVEARLIDDAALQKAALQQKSTGSSLTANLVKTGAITEEGLLDFLSNFYGAPAIDLKNYEPDPALIS